MILVIIAVDCRVVVVGIRNVVYVCSILDMKVVDCRVVDVDIRNEVEIIVFVDIRSVAEIKVTVHIWGY